MSPATAEVDVASAPVGLPQPPPEGASALAPGTFSETVVLVTGGGTGLGAAIAEEFARLDASVAVISRDQAHLDAANAILAKYEKPFFSCPCDIRDPDQVQEAFDAIERRLGLPDVLVNNAAANFPVCAEDLSPNGWRTVVDITLNGTFYMTREFGRRHLKLERAGSIVCIGASYAWTGGPGFVHSAAAKAGVKNLVETLAVEWGPFGIQINGLVPGLVPHADMTRDIRANLGDENDRRQPAMRVGQRREIGWAATFLASPFARFISGHTLVVDGANWQRRDLTNPPVATIREQMGRRPIES